jgi:hypothetical protein
LGELRFVSDELSFVREICSASGTDFQTHYQDFCDRNSIDIRDLNKTHAKKIQDLYSQKTGDHAEQDPQLDSSADGALVPHEPLPQKNINSDVEEEYPQQLGEYQMTQDELEIHESFNKIFRKLAMILHPDKLPPNLTKAERQDKLKMFKEAKTALEERRYFVLLDLAQKFNISLPRNYRQQIRWMKKEIASLSATVKKEKDTYNYLFSECETQEEKDYIVKRFMRQIFGPQIFENFA